MARLKQYRHKKGSQTDLTMSSVIVDSFTAFIVKLLRFRRKNLPQSYVPMQLAGSNVVYLKIATTQKNQRSVLIHLVSLCCCLKGERGNASVFQSATMCHIFFCSHN